VPRSSLHDQIHAQLARDAADSSTKTLVVWGLGGAGKTQLVLDYVQQHRAEYKATFWIACTRRCSVCTRLLGQRRRQQSALRMP
jgi:late competence protein required for DNA uptake (superfamily II DNA/RNA helicase)